MTTKKLLQRGWRVAKALWRILSRFIDGLRKTLHLFLLLFIFGLLLIPLSLREAPIPSHVALVLHLQGELIEQSSSDPWQEVMDELSGARQTETDMPTLRRALAYAKNDRRVGAVVLDINDLQSGALPKLDELAQLLAEVKSTGKPILVYSEYYSQPQYYLAANANQIYLHPSGAVLIEGFSAYRQYFKEAIDKLAIDWNVFRVGEYKSFVEPFERNDMSEADRQATGAWLEQLWRHYVAGVASARGISEQQVTQYLDDLIHGEEVYRGDFATLAKDLELVDDLISSTDFDARMIALVGRDELTGQFSRIDQYRYVRKQREELKENTETAIIGVVVADGTMVEGGVSPGILAYSSVVNALHEAAENEKVHALVLRIDSPGGSKLVAENLAAELELFKRSGKPLIVSMSGVAASGGYWIAVAGDEIFADATTLTGSIGVGGFLPTFERSLNKLGVHVDGVGTTPLAGTLRLDRSLDPQLAALIQANVEYSYQQFIDQVSTHRGMAPEQVRMLAEGRVWTGEDALNYGLIDQLGDFQTAIDAAADAASIEKYRVVYLEELTDWRLEFANRFARMAAPHIAAWRHQQLNVDRLDDERWLRALRELSLLSAMIGGRNSVAAWCWCGYQ